MPQHVILDADLATPARLTLEWAERAGGGREARIDGESLEVDAARISPGVVSVRVGGRVFDVVFDGRPPECRVVARGRVTAVKLEDDRRTPARGRAPAGGERSVRSPMPGRVVKVLVAVGERVEAGQGLVVLEAMKMENEVRARVAGVVAKIEVQAGASVESNTPLVTLS